MDGVIRTLSSFFFLFFCSSSSRDDDGRTRSYTAVQRAKFFGLPQRPSNSGRGDPELWDRLTGATCDDQGAPEFLPAGEIERMKLPRAILIGVQKGGTTALYEYLDRHPLVERTKKELYFLDEEMDKLVTRAGKIPRKVARNLYQLTMRDGIAEARALRKKRSRDCAKQQTAKRLQNKTSVRRAKERNKDCEDPPYPRQGEEDQTRNYLMDLTPNYMFHSDRLPNRIHCLVPWVRLLVLLRHPVARARSQYQMKLRMVLPKRRNSYGNPLPTLDEYIEHDLNALREVGVLQNWTEVDFESFWESPACWKAWESYIHRGLNAPVGMGLYALQLKPFLDKLAEIHGGSANPSSATAAEEVAPTRRRDQKMIPSEYFLAVDSRDLQLDADKTYQEVLKFLGLPPFHLAEYPLVNKASVRNSKARGGDHHSEKLSAAVQRRLEEAIAPYNRKLGDLLGEEWREKWPPSSSSLSSSNSS